MMFTLISVSKSTENNAVLLKLDGNSLDVKNFSKYWLVLHGLKEESEFIQKISVYIDSFIDVDEIEAGKLEFWSDAYQIGIFEFATYEEVIKPFEIEDWITAYKSRVKYHRLESAKHTKDEVRWRRFVDTLDTLLKKEITNYKVKNEFLADNTNAIQANLKAIDLAKKIQNLIEDYRLEEQKDKNE